jgi:hypothetical protein
MAMHKVRSGSTAAAGVALVTVLAVLTVLGLLAAAFAIFTATDTMTSRTSVARVTADMMCAAGLNHALSALWADSVEQPAWDDPSEGWRATFTPASRLADDAADIDGIPGLVPGEAGTDGRWIYVPDANGRIVGRYAVQLEDECSKININMASAIGTHGQNMGVGPFELLMSDGRGRGLPLSLDFCAKALRHRYGRDGAPGKRGADDNLTESTYGNDEIDNDADGVVDELGEGIDEQEEYSSVRPVWDDRAFSSVDELLEKCGAGRMTTATARRMLRRYATMYGRSREMFYDERAGTWRRQVNLNVAARDQIRRLMNRANAESRFESSTRNMAILVANVMDYRDENNVLTTAGSEYGVEAVCFNEVVSYDCSFFQETDYGGWGDGTVLSYNRFYGADKWGGGMNSLNRWKVSKVTRQGNSELYTVELSPPQRKGPYYNEFIECENQTGGWPKNLWRGATHGKPGAAWIGKGQNLVEYEVDSNPAGKKEVTVRCRANQVNVLTNNDDKTICLLNGWQQHGAMFCDQPENTEMFCFMVPSPSFPTIGWGDLFRQDYKSRNYYYKAINANHCFDYLGPSRIREMDMDGDGNTYSIEKELQSKDGTYRLQYEYKDGKGVRQTRSGFIPVVVTSSTRCRTSDPSSPQNYCNFSDSMYFVRPDIVELINISERPISLRNWRVVVNTGIEANELATIDMARYYRRGKGKYDDPNPCIPPNGYFYLTNNRELFGVDYCDGNHEYGSNMKEVNPVFELPDREWGISYKVTRVPDNEHIYVEGAIWRPDQMKGEMVEYEVTRNATASRDVPNGQMKIVFGNGRNFVRVSHPKDSGLKAGDRIRFRGLPRQGGFVSFTMRDEYGQVTARTTEYGSLDEDELGYSTEKYDPTHYTWVKSPRPTISGDPLKSRNNALTSGAQVPAHVKDNRFVSVGEIQKVRKAADWENIGMSGRGKTDVQTLKAIARYFTTSGIRLDPEEQGAHVSGWKPAFGAALTRSIDDTFRTSCSWEPNIWAGQTLRVMSGAQNGEKYFITNSTQSGLTIAGYSTQNSKQLRVLPGDRFSVGPGYSTPMFYCRQNGEAGVWEWQNKDLEPMSYGLYLSGLSDSINTTEFLEENHNAILQVDVFNFRTEAFEQVPLARDNYSVSAADDVYQMVRSRTSLQYDKSDNVYCGMIHAEHISASGGIRLRITPRGLSDKLCSGLAWFDYAILTPGGAFGKLNINTASERVLAALPKTTPVLAANIARGIDRVGRPTLKPYRNITDVLDVRGMTPDTFSVIANLITTRSDQFRVHIMAEALDCRAADGTYDPKRGDRITSRIEHDTVVDRARLTNESAGDNAFAFLPSK